VAKDLPKGAGKIVAVVKPRCERGFGAVGFAGAQQGRGVVQPPLQQDLVKSGPRSVLEDAVELIGAGGASSGGFGKRELGTAPGRFVEDQCLCAFGNQSMPPGRVPKMFPEAAGALGGSQAEGNEPDELGVNHRGITEFSLLIFFNNSCDAGVHLTLVVRAEHKGPCFGGVDQTKEHGPFVLHREPPEIESGVPGIGYRKIQRQAECGFAVVAQKMVFTARGNHKNAPLADFVTFAVGHELPFAPPIVEQLMVGVGVRLCAVGGTDVLIPLHPPEVEYGMAQPVIDLDPENLLPPLGDQPSGIEWALDELGGVHVGEG